MTANLYTFLRGATGFTFAVIGIGFLVEPKKKRVHKAFGALYLALGMIFLLSYLGGYWIMPLVLDNFFIIAIVYTISQALFEISLYLFGDEAVPGYRRKVYLVGLAVSALFWFLPLLDSILGLTVIAISVEDSRPVAPFQLASSIGVYAWPVAISVISMRAGRWHIDDLPRGPGATRMILTGVASLVVLFGFIGMALLFSSQSLYRLGHTILELMMLALYFFYKANPDVFLEARKEIGTQHKRRKHLEPKEIIRIQNRLDHLVLAENVHTRPELDLRSLSKKLNLPSYRISTYFNTVLGMSFPEWLNSVRIDHVRRLLASNSDMSILEISMEAGYSSKAVFNNQFLKQTGMSPSEYKAGISK